MWLTGRLAPDHKTIADFRRDNGPAIRETCAQFVELCRRIGVLKGDCVAIDGSKFKAVNNRDKNFTKGKIASRTAHLDASIERYLDEMVRIDRQEEGEVRAEKIANLAQRCERIRQEIERLVDMGQALRESPDSQISLTDPDARSMATSAKGSGFVGYNAQSAVDTETHLIVTHDVINAGHDREQLSPMAKGAKAALGRDEMSAVADKGYFSGREILACHEDGITTTLPRPETSGNRKKGMYVKADFAYDAEADVYRCPAGETLTYRYTTEEGGPGRAALLDQRLSDLPGQGALHHRQGAPDHPMGTRASGRRDARPPEPRPRLDGPAPLDGRAPVRHDQSLDGRDALPDAQAQKRPHRDGIPCPRLQHQAHDRPDRCTRASGRHSGLNRRSAQIVPQKRHKHQ